MTDHSRSRLPSLSVGDRLILRRIQGGRAEQEVVVTRLGRKWGYAAAEGLGSHWETKFDLETGYEDAGRYGSTMRVLTPEMDTAEKRRGEAMAGLNSHGLRFDWGGQERNVSTETIEAIVDLLSAEEAS